MLAVADDRFSMLTGLGPRFRIVTGPIVSHDSISSIEMIPVPVRDVHLYGRTVLTTPSVEVKEISKSVNATSGTN